MVCSGGSGGLFWVRGCSAAALGVFAVAQAPPRALLSHQGKAGTGVVVYRGCFFHKSITPRFFPNPILFSNGDSARRATPKFKKKCFFLLADSTYTIMGVKNIFWWGHNRSPRGLFTSNLEPLTLTLTLTRWCPPVVWRWSAWAVGGPPALVGMCVLAEAPLLALLHIKGRRRRGRGSA